MPFVRPNYPFLLRVLHGVHGILALTGLVTGYWLYDTWDQRFGHLSLPNINQTIYQIHVDYGNWFYAVLPIFTVYCAIKGRQRLIQLKRWKHLFNLGKPSWWYFIHQCINTGLLIAGILAISTGKVIAEDTLQKGRLMSFWYNAHLLSWVMMLILFSAHLFVSYQIGGLTSLRTMMSWRLKLKDSRSRLK